MMQVMKGIIVMVLFTAKVAVNIAAATSTPSPASIMLSISMLLLTQILYVKFQRNIIIIYLL